MGEVEGNHAGWSSWKTAPRAASGRKQWKGNVSLMCLMAWRELRLRFGKPNPT